MLWNTPTFFIGSCLHSKKFRKLRETLERLLHLAQNYYNYCEELIGIMLFFFFLSFFVGMITSVEHLDSNSWNKKMVSDFIVLWSYSTRSGHLPISLCVTFCLPYNEWVRPGMSGLDIVALRRGKVLEKAFSTSNGSTVLGSTLAVTPNTEQQPLCVGEQCGQVLLFEGLWSYFGVPRGNKILKDKWKKLLTSAV